MTKEGGPRPSIPGEGALFAGDLALGYRQAVEFFHKTIGYPLPEAVDIVRKEGDADDLAAGLLRAPPQEVAWHMLAVVAERAPDMVPAIWERLVELARVELATGRRAAAPFRDRTNPFDQAQFLVLRGEFREAWMPQGGIEDALVDALAQSHTAFLFWLARLHEASLGPRGDEETSRAVDQAAVMVDRFNRMFVRTLRTLRELRQRPAPAVAIGTAAQVNVAAVQRNEAVPPAPTNRARRTVPRPRDDG